MTPEERKIYNRKYYKQNKEEIIEKITVKVKCPDCGRSVSKQNLSNHKRTMYCVNHNKKNDGEKLTINDLYKKYEEVKKELKTLKKG